MTDELVDALIRRLDVPSEPDPEFASSTYAALLPRALQRKHEMPWSTPQDARARSARALDRLSRRVTTLVRRARGQDVGGACGQLAGERRRS